MKHEILDAQGAYCLLGPCSLYFRLPRMPVFHLTRDELCLHVFLDPAV